MAGDEEPILTNPPTHEVAVHIHDYERFTKIMKWGALFCLVVGFVVLQIL